MDIKDLNKKQMILLTLLITFVVSIATGIVTVSLMNQAPKAIPQTINNIIQRTIEKVTTPALSPTITKNTPDANTSIGINTNSDSQNKSISLMEGNVLVSIYSSDYVSSPSVNVVDGTISVSVSAETKDKSLGQGIIISDIGLILVDSNVLNNGDKYIVVLDKTDFDAAVIKKFNNGFSILQISKKINSVSDTATNTPSDGTGTLIDKTQ